MDDVVSGNDNSDRDPLSVHHATANVSAHCALVVGGWLKFLSDSGARRSNILSCAIVNIEPMARWHRWRLQNVENANTIRVSDE